MYIYLKCKDENILTFKTLFLDQFVLKSFVYYVRHLGPELNQLRFSVVV